MKKIITSFLIIMSSSLFGIHISGKVIDAKSDKGVPNVLVISQSSLGEIDSLFTDSLGLFDLQLSRKGAYKITAKSQSSPKIYHPSKTKIIAFNRGFTVPSTIVLKLEPFN